VTEGDVKGKGNEMNKIDFGIIEVRYGMAAPIWYFRIFIFVIMWWGWNNGKFEFTTTLTRGKL